MAKLPDFDDEEEIVVAPAPVIAPPVKEVVNPIKTETESMIAAASKQFLLTLGKYSERVSPLIIPVYMPDFVKAIGKKKTIEGIRAAIDKQLDESLDHAESLCIDYMTKLDWLKENASQTPIADAELQKLVDFSMEYFQKEIARLTGDKGFIETRIEPPRREISVDIPHTIDTVVSILARGLFLGYEQTEDVLVMIGERIEKKRHDQSKVLM
jgi:hypothetical protein